MLTIDEQNVAAPPDLTFAIAADVERWPVILPHYRWVKFQSKRDDGGIVEMAAWRPFPAAIKYPTWWVSQMRIDSIERAVYYTHIDGITTGMDVKWHVTPTATGCHIRLVHEWAGPSWPLIGAIAANVVIGPHFVSAIAQRTLAGVAREAERQAK